MGKQDKNQAKGSIANESKRAGDEGDRAIQESANRTNQVRERSDAERGNVLAGYGNMAAGGISQANRDALNGTGNRDNYESAEGGGGGGVGSSAPNEPEYMSVFRDLAGKTGGYDSNRLSNVEGVAGRLSDTRNNYNDVNANIGKLGNVDFSGVRNSVNDIRNIDRSGSQDMINKLKEFGATGGITDDDTKNIRRDSLLDFEKTGGYGNEDLANIRSRSNSGASAVYRNLTDTMKRNAATGAAGTPGLDAATMQLARKSAQDVGTTARDTEIGIKEKVNAARMDASKELAKNQLEQTKLRTGNQLTGYTNAGDLDVARTGQIGNAASQAGNLELGISGQTGTNLAAAGKLGIDREAGITDAAAKSADINQTTQRDINNSRLGGAGGQQTETLTRAQIDAQNANAAASRGQSGAQFQRSLDAENQRFMMGLENDNARFGISGQADMYSAAPGELIADQNLLRGYRQDRSSDEQNAIGSRINAGYMPGLGSDISTGLGIAGQIAGMGGGMVPGLSGITGAGKSNLGQVGKVVRP